MTAGASTRPTSKWPAGGPNLYRAVDQVGQVLEVVVSDRRDLAAARWFFTRPLQHTPKPVEVTTGRPLVYQRVLDELLPAARHITERQANNRIEADHGRLKARIWPMRGLKRDRTAIVVASGHAFVQNLRRGHYELAIDLASNDRLPAVFRARTRRLIGA